LKIEYMTLRETLKQFAEIEFEVCPSCYQKVVKNHINGTSMLCTPMEYYKVKIETTNCYVCGSNKGLENGKKRNVRI